MIFYFQFFSRHFIFLLTPLQSKKNGNSSSQLRALRCSKYFIPHRRFIPPPVPLPTIPGIPKETHLKSNLSYVTGARWHVNIVIHELLNNWKEFSLQESLSEIRQCLMWSILNVGLGTYARIKVPYYRTGVGSVSHLAQHPAWRRY